MTEELVLSTEQNVLAVIEKAATNPDVDVAKMSALLDMQLKIMAKQAEISFNKDFALASKEIPKIARNGVIDMGQKGKMSFAKYEDLDKAIKPVEEQHGFTRSFLTSPNPNGIEVTIKLSHRDGHSVTSSRLMPPDTGAGRNAMQAIGSASSYAKRYLTLDIWNVITVGADDDGAKSGAITDAQIAVIDELLEKSGANVSRFLAYMQVDNVASIQQSDFQTALAALKQKAGQKK